jgi:hypothetical protein
MKRYVIITLAVLFHSLVATAKCAFEGIYVVGYNQSLHKNSILILEFYYKSQDRVPEINNKYLVWLVSKNAKVALQPIEVLKGGMNVTEVIFRPTGDLVEGDVYTLQIDNLSKGESPDWYNEASNKFEPYSFAIIKDLPASSSLSFTKAPVETGKEYMPLGCGPARHVHFSIDADSSVRYVKAKVKDLYTGQTTIYILVVDKNTTSVGHGMCGGAFDFSDGEKYTVSFALMDASGNEGKFCDAIGFRKPIPSNESYKYK